MAYYYGAKCRPVFTSQGRLMYDNRRRLLANRSTCTGTSLDLMMSSGRIPLDSSSRTLIDQRLLRVTARTKIQTIVAWAKT